jgi:hypothetical protein
VLPGFTYSRVLLINSLCSHPQPGPRPPRQLNRHAPFSFCPSSCSLLLVRVSRIARWFIFKPKIQIWVNFRGPCNRRPWFILCPFGIFYGPLIYFIWQIFWSFGNLVYFMFFANYFRFGVF